MRPIQVRVAGRTTRSPAEICEQFLDTARWSAFRGYLLIPGIAQAHFETRTPQVLGSRIKVQNRDGSSHVEEIVEWDPTRRITFRFQEFTPPLKYLASHFVETWTFSKSSVDTHVTRQMALYPRGFLGWLLLFPISKMMQRAFEKNQHQ